MRRIICKIVATEGEGEGDKLGIKLKQKVVESAYACVVWVV